MARILEIQKKSAEYLSGLDDNIVRIIEDNQDGTLIINKSQMKDSMNADGGPLIHRLTGSEYLSKAYAKRTGKRKPNLLREGDFQREMFLNMPSAKEYLIGSYDWKTAILHKNYGNIMGIAPENRPKAQEINNKLVIEDYLKTVFR
jgi:hypothetical protein